jgi:hypothetical protein
MAETVTVELGPELAHAFARVRGNRVRLYDRKTKQLLIEHTVDGIVNNGDTITMPTFTVTSV